MIAVNVQFQSKISRKSRLWALKNSVREEAERPLRLGNKRKDNFPSVARFLLILTVIHASRTLRREKRGANKSKHSRKHWQRFNRRKWFLAIEWPSISYFSHTRLGISSETFTRKSSAENADMEGFSSLFLCETFLVNQIKMLRISYTQRKAKSDHQIIQQIDKRNL